MPVVAAIRSEYRRYRRLVELAVEQLVEADLHRCLAADGNSVAMLIGHLTGNLQSRFTDFLSSDGEKPWRQRDREFEDPGLQRAQLLTAWDTAWGTVERALDEVEAAGPDGLEHNVCIRAQPLSVIEALQRSLAHVAYHAGQIVLLARSFAGQRWRSLSIPRGGSTAYTANPLRERGPDAAR